MTRLLYLIFVLIAALCPLLCQAKEKPEQSASVVVTDQASFDEALEKHLMSGKNTFHVILNLRPELADKNTVNRIKRQAKRKGKKNKSEREEAQAALAEADKYSYLKGKSGSEAISAIIEHSHCERFVSEYRYMPVGAGWQLSFTVEDSTRMLAAHRNPKLRAQLNRKEQKALDELTNRLKTIIKPDMEPREKVIAICEDLQKRVKYSYAGDDQSCTQVILRNSGVCEGNSRYIFLALEMQGIESLVITGKADKGAHAWNMVKLDGQWHHLDVTWKIGLVSGATMRKAYNHEWDADLYPATAEECPAGK